MVAGEDFALLEIGDADHRAPPHVGETLEVLDEILRELKFAFDVVPATTSSYPRWPCKSTFAGITVLPARLTRVAPAGTCSWPCRPTAVNRLFWTMKTEFSMGALPSPVMSRAPSNTVTPLPAGVWVWTEHAAAKNRQATTSR